MFINVLINVFICCVCVPLYAHLCRGTSVSVEGSTHESIYPPTLWILEMKFRSSTLMAGDFTH